MSVERIANRYAKSLLDLGIEQNKLDKLAEDMKVLDQGFAFRELELMLRSPIINKDAKSRVLEQVFAGKVDDLTKHFMQVIVRKNRENLLPEIAKAFTEQYRKYLNISSVKLTTAAPLEEAQINAIKERLRQSGSVAQNVEIETEIDPSLIGGFVLEFDGKRFDSSVASSLEKLRKEFTSNKFSNN